MASAKFLVQLTEQSVLVFLVETAVVAGSPGSKKCCEAVQGKATMSAVLVSAGIELIFFLVAGIMLWFGFSMRIMLLTH